MKNIVIKEIVDFIIDTLDKYDGDRNLDHMFHSLSFGDFIIRGGKIIPEKAPKFGLISVYSKYSCGQWDKPLFDIEVTERIVYLWDNKELKKEKRLINKLCKSISNFIVSQKIRLENATYKKYFDMLPDDIKKQRLRNKD